MLERYGFYCLVGGATLALVAFVITVRRAFQAGSGWGVLTLIFPPTALVFVAVRSVHNRLPAGLFVAAAALIGLPYALSYYERNFLPLEPYEQIVDGELRLTLTGLKDFNYAKLRDKPNVVVLQMANADVNDTTLDYVAGLSKLRTLDLRDTQITDAGLAKIAALPALTELYLGRTKISDAGFNRHLAGKESLIKLDFTATEVKGKTKRDWKQRRPEMREYVD